MTALAIAAAVIGVLLALVVMFVVAAGAAPDCICGDPDCGGGCT